MDLMSSSALSSLETKAMAIWTSSGQLQLERRVCSAPHVYGITVWRYYFRCFPQGRSRYDGCVLFLAEEFCRRLYRYVYVDVGGKFYLCHLSTFWFIYLKALEFIHYLNIAHRVSTPFNWCLSVRYDYPCDFCRMHSKIFLLSSGTQSRCARWRFPYPALEFISSTSKPQCSSQQDAP